MSKSNPTCDKCGRPVFTKSGKVAAKHQFQWISPYRWFLACNEPYPIEGQRKYRGFARDIAILSRPGGSSHE